MNILKKIFYPHYDESTLFCIGYSFLLLVTFQERTFVLFSKPLAGMFFNAGLNSGFEKLKMFMVIIAYLLFLFGFFYGLIYSIYHIFIKRKKTAFEKGMMFIFVLPVSLIAGFFAAANSYGNSEGIHKLIAIWNLINILILFILMKFRLIHDDVIEEKNSNIMEGAVGFIAISCIFYYAHYINSYYWAVTFSLCVLYSTNINRFVSVLLSPLTYKNV